MKIDPSKMWEQFVQNMVPEITMVVKFCKKIPGMFILMKWERFNVDEVKCNSMCVFNNN